MSRAAILARAMGVEENTIRPTPTNNVYAVGDDVRGVKMAEWYLVASKDEAAEYGLESGGLPTDMNGMLAWRVR